MSKKKGAFNSYLRDIWLELPKYKFNHKPIEDPDDPRFVGRKTIEDRLLSYLIDGNDSGSYLITGYRGMGKTSFVKKVVRRYKKESKQIVRDVTISFGQKNIKEIDVLRQIIHGIKINLLSEPLEWVHTRIFKMKSLPFWTAFIFILIASYGAGLLETNPANNKAIKSEAQVVIGANAAAHGVAPTLDLAIDEVETPKNISKVEEFDLSKTYWKNFFSNNGLEMVSASILISVVLGFFVLQFFMLLFRISFPKVRLYDRLDDLYDRCRSQITKEGGTSGAGDRFPFGMIERLVKQFPLANPKEVENEILGILKKVNSNSTLRQPWRLVPMSIFLLLSAFGISALIITVLKLLSIIFSHPPIDAIPEEFIQFCLNGIIYVSKKLLFSFGTEYIKELQLDPISPAVKVSSIASFIFMVLLGASLLPQIRGKRKFVFVFDEIDKIEPVQTDGSYHEDLDSFAERTHKSLIYDYRERKIAVINILANLKYLITIGRAQFIFIAGREMFDASLADIADRQSSISSIFNQVIYVDSFLKDRTYPVEREKTTGVTSLIEEYLERILLDGSDFGKLHKEEPFLKRYYLSLKQSGIEEAARLKIIYTLQSFIVYLTYRSNGSPKKLVRLIEDFIYPEEVHTDIKPDQKELLMSLPYYKFRFFVNSLWIWTANKILRLGHFKREKYWQGLHKILKNHPIERRKKLIERSMRISRSYATDRNLYVYQVLRYSGGGYFLRFDYLNQYRFNFVGYLYRPFLISHGNFMKSYSDRLLVSTPYLMDHIIKFHPFAFSLQNLELIPEVLSETRTPELRRFIEDMVNYLSQNHIRNTEIGLFDYKFLNKTFHEIGYLCRLFEDESAAFNFTLDETYNVKFHLRNKIKELRSIFKDYGLNQQNNYFASIIFLNDILGDSHFFDQEYDEAIVAYSDALQQLEGIESKDLGIEKFILKIRLKLKIGLTYEKMKAFEVAASIYVNAIFIAKGFIYSWRKGRKQKKEISKISSKSDMLQIIVQPIIAELFLQEKLSVEGVTTDKLAIAEANFRSLVKLILPLDKEEENLNIVSNFKWNIGTFLFYKNFPENRILNEDIENATQGEREEYLRFIRYKELVSSEITLKDFRTSSLAYAYYKQSLTELIRKTGVELIDANFLTLLRAAEDIISSRLPSDLKNEKAGFPKDKKGREYAQGFSQLDKMVLKNIAIALYKIGDCLLSALNNGETGIVITGDEDNRLTHMCFRDHGGENVRYWSFYDNVFEVFRGKNDVSSEKLVQLVLCIYFWSGHYYLRAGKNLAASFQFRKVMYVIKGTLNPDSIGLYLPLMRDWFLKMILKITSWNSNVTDRFQLYKYKYYTEIETILQPEERSKYNYLNLSMNPEVKEAILLYVSAKLHANMSIGEEEDNAEIDEGNLLSQYNTITTQFIRIRELHLQVMLNKRDIEDGKGETSSNGFIELKKMLAFWDDVFWAAFENSRITPKGERGGNTPHDYFVNEIEQEFIGKLEDGMDVSQAIKIGHITRDNFHSLIHLVVNSIFCLNEIVSIINRYGVNFMMNHSTLGDTHRRLGDWYVKYEFCKFIFDRHVEDLMESSGYSVEDLNVKNLLKSLIQGDKSKTKDAFSQYQLALQNYNRAKLAHYEGEPYKNLLVNMYYLEDDFNDSIYHFCIAVERQRINSGELRRHIDKLNRRINYSPMYDYYSYVNNVALEELEN